MKALKVIGIIILALFGGYVLWAFMSPKTIDCTKTVEVNKDVNTVFHVAKDFNLNKQWSAWMEMDKEAKSEIIGSGKEVGDVWKWDGPELGQGALTHIALVPNQSIQNKVEFFGENSGSIEDNWVFEEKDGKVHITVTDKGTEEVPFFKRPFMAMTISGMLQKSLDNLKAMAEGMAEIPAETQTAAAEIAVEDMGEIWYVGIADSCEVSKISENFTEDYGKLKNFMEKNKIETTGAPMGIFSYYDGKTTSFIAAFPVKGEVKVEPGIIFGKIPAGKGIAATHTGPYEKSEAVHMAIDEYAKGNNMKTSTAIEIYENDPGTVKPEEIRTKIIYPIQG